MKSVKISLCGLLVILSSLCFPTGALAQTEAKLAEWTFASGYDKTDVDGKTVYVPNSNEWAEISATWFKDQAPYFYPNVFEGEQGSYMLSAQSESRYWQVSDSNGDKVMRIENSEANNITDYTDASQHNVYYEVSFPTTGYKNISLTYAIGYGGNAEAAIEAVFSTDGGETWIDAGKGTTAPNWWIYNENTVKLSANNKDKVIVRLIAGNGLVSNWNLKQLTVSAEKDESSQGISAKDATVAWPFNEGASNPTSAEASVPEALSSTGYTLGSKLTLNGTQKCDPEVMSKLEPTEKINNALDENSFISFAVVPKKGINFTPKKITFNAAKCGTSGGTMDIYAVSGDQKVAIASNVNPERNPAFSSYDYDLSQLGTLNDKLEIFIYVYNLNAGKQLAINNVSITADFEGTPVAVPVYTLSVKSGMEGAGNVSSNPSGTEFDEGTSITVTATENFGYHFQSWNNDKGEVVSTENPYTFEISENTSLTAVYTKNNVYALNLTLEGGANTNLVQFSPEGNVVDGVHYYEEGTDVKLTVLNNRILTFTNWEDNSTDAVREISMDGDKQVTATFSCADYIVGWDLYSDTPAKERAADYKAESDNAGLLSLRNAEGLTSSWLACGSEKGGQNGKYAARVWRDLSEKYYFEISFSTKEYSNIKLSAAVGDDFNAHSIVNAEYSIDGQTYTKFGTYTLPYRAWAEGEFDLPADAAGQDRVYIRFMPDWTSELVGSESNLDGTAVAEIFVLADRNIVDDGEAPKLVSTLPADKAKDVTANGSVILTFNEKVVAAANDGKATLDGEEIVPTVSGKTVVYKYTGLKYSTDYTFTLPAGAIEDRTGNAFEGVSLTFTTMERKQPEARVYDAVVAQDGTGDYTTVQAAIDAAPEGRVKPWLIFIKEGVYKEHVDVPESKPYLHFIGQDRNKVSISDDKLCGGDNALHVDVGATFVARAENLYFEGISFVNSYGVEQNAGPQALALNTKNDRLVFNNCGMYSYQDTWITPSDSHCRAYVKNCFIEGAVDFIYNNGDYYFDGDTLNIVRKDGGYIVAPSHNSDSKWGYVFMNNVITAPGVPSETSVWLGRPWHDQPKTVFINTKAEVTIPATGWYETMGAIPAIFADYNTVDGEGNPVDLSQRRSYYYYYADDDKTQKVEGYAKNSLTDEEAAQYTVKNVLSGDDNWQPEIITEACDAPVPVISKSEQTITWDAVPYAICYVITKNGSVEGFTTATSCSYTDGDEYLIQAVNEYGGLSNAGKASEGTVGIDGVEAGQAITVTGIYSADGVKLNTYRKGVNIVTGKTADGKVVSKTIVK